MAPRDLYSPVPTAKPEQTRGIETPSVRIDFPTVHISGAVGEALGQVGRLGYGTLSDATRHVAGAFDSLGKSLTGAGDEIFKRAMGLQELENETKEKKALVEYERYAIDKRLEFNQKTGDAANGSTMKAHLDDLEAKRQELRGKLAPVSQRSFDGSSIPIMGREGIHAATHAATETKKAAVGASEARMKSAVDAFGKSTSIDGNEAQRFFNTIYDETHGTYAPLTGMRPEQANEHFKSMVGAGIAGKLLNIGDNDPRTALRMLEENKDWLGVGQYDQLKKSLNNRLEIVEGRNIADEVENRDRDAPLEDKIEAAKKKAKEVNPDNPDLPAAAEHRVITMHNIHRQEERQEQEKYLNTAQDAAYGYSAPGGKKPKTQEELEADPQAKVAYGALKPTQKHRIDEILRNNAKEDYSPTPATRARYNQLYGAAKSNNAAEVAEFLQTNLEEEKIPASQREQLYHMQAQMRGKPLAENPMMTHAMRVLQPMLPEPIRKGTSPNLRKEFMGALYIALQDAQERKGKVPLTSDEIKEEGARILQTVGETEGVRGLGWVPSLFDRPLFEQMRDVPKVFEENLRRLQPNITDQKILDEWSHKRLRTRFDELQETVKPTTKPAGPKPPTVPQGQ